MTSILAHPEKSHSIQKASYLKSLKRREKKVFLELKTYVNAQSPDAVHDLRTSIRKLEAVIRVLPKRVRKRKSIRNYSCRLNNLLKMNTQIRDYDILLSRLKEEGEQSDSLDSIIEEKRDQRRVESKKEAMKLVRKDAPVIKNISQKRLDRRFGNLIDKFDSRIVLALPIVVTDPKQDETLHLMRKNCKRLRYALELGPKQRYSKTIELLVSWQDLLGSIHDTDVVLEFLQKHGSPLLDRFIESQKTRRSQEYESFQKSFKTSFTRMPRSLLKSAGVQQE